MPVENFEEAKPGSKPLKLKKLLDKTLPFILVLLAFYLYLETLGSSETFLYSYKIHMQYIILFYFIAEVLVLFSLYDENRKFLRNHWLDLLLTIPFVSALKGVRGLKLLKSLKIGKILKTWKLGKIAKVTQKAGKLVKKGKKQSQKLVS